MTDAPGPFDWVEVAVLLPVGWFVVLGLTGRTIETWRCPSAAGSCGIGTTEFGLWLGCLGLVGLVLGLRRLSGSMAGAITGSGGVLLLLRLVDILTCGFRGGWHPCPDLPGPGLLGVLGVTLLLVGATVSGTRRVFRRLARTFTGTSA